MKLFLMCAGKGERLGNLTKDIPKCLIPIGGRPMLQRWLDACRDCRVSDVLINTSYHSDKIMDYLKDVNIGSTRISIFKEENALGTAKTLLVNRRFVKGEHYFAVVYADVWTTFDLKKMINFHKKRSCMVTLGLTNLKSVEGKGVAVVEEGIVTSFEERPKNPRSNSCWAGLFIAHTSIFNVIEPNMVDIGKDLLPKLAVTGRMVAFNIKEPLIDMGTPEGLKEALNKSKSMGLAAI